MALPYLREVIESFPLNPSSYEMAAKIVACGGDYTVFTPPFKHMRARPLVMLDPGNMGVAVVTSFISYLLAQIWTTSFSEPPSWMLDFRYLLLVIISITLVECP